MRKQISAIAAIIAGCLISGGGLQAAPSSAYSDIALDKCALLEAEPEFGSALWRCDGIAGYDIFLREGDLRFYIAFGRDGAFPGTHGQTLAPFNRLGAKLEWRLDEEGQPFATIVRYFVDRGSHQAAIEPLPDGQVLVVSKFEEGESCHMAFIDALETPDANMVARNVADERSAHFVCRSDAPDLEGVVGEDLGIR
ncbi:conserved protein [Tepidicaulis marinus]|uniref:Conserved protein n=1 Tax=Tepidicaulis marinus TaxID=1333998 RepID=A0A081BDF8_9HYPH|nr:hypothetical protein [Tepidicaulis marinus]GAK46076.1 conserved protein [Tepidicaulis marinus]